MLLFAARQCFWIWMLMEPVRTLILPLGDSHALLPLLLLHATAAARRSAAACPAVLAAACPAVLAADLLACSKRQQHWELAPNCAARYLNFRPKPEDRSGAPRERQDRPLAGAE